MIGKIIQSTSRIAGTSTVGVEAAGQVVISLDNVLDFASDVGAIIINGEVLLYDGIDRVGNTMTLNVPLATELPAGTPVRVFPYSVQRWAFIEVDSPTATDAVWAVVPHSLAAFIRHDGLRNLDEREKVRLEKRGNSLVVVDVIDRQPAIDAEAIPDGIITIPKIEPAFVEQVDANTSGVAQAVQEAQDAYNLATSAESSAASAEAAAAAATSAASTAQTAADDAATAASTAQTAADDAATAAAEAAGIAESKGKVLIQSTAPAVADRLPQNLWIDTTGGANTPKRWDGDSWEPVTDKAATDAATAAAEAASAASAAQSTATAAQAAATAAQNDVNAVETRVTTAEGGISAVESRVTTAEGDITSVEGRISTAESSVSNHETRLDTAEGTITSIDGRVDTAEATINSHSTRLDGAESDIEDITTIQLPGKNKVTYSGSAPGTAPNTAGDTWFVFSGGQITSMWKGNGGTSWTQEKFNGATLSNLDAGTITAGTLAAARIAANTIDSSKIVTAGLDAAVIKFGTMSGARIETGTLTVGQVSNLQTTLDSKATPAQVTAAAAAAETAAKDYAEAEAEAARLAAIATASGDATAKADAAEAAATAAAAADALSKANTAKSEAIAAAAADAQDKADAAEAAATAAAATYAEAEAEAARLAAIATASGDATAKADAAEAAATAAAAADALAKANTAKSEAISAAATAAATAYGETKTLVAGWRTTGQTTIEGGKIRADSILSAQIGAGQITADELAANAVTAVKVAANAIEADKIAANAITAGKIAANAVEAGKIAANAVTTNTLAANAVIAEKIAANAIAATHIQSGVIEAGHIKAGTITSNELNADVLRAGFVLTGAIQVGESTWNPEEGLVIPQPGGSRIHLPADGVTPATLGGHADLESATVKGNFNLLGITNKVSGELELSSGITEPTSAPSTWPVWPAIYHESLDGSSAGWRLITGMAPHHSNADWFVTVVNYGTATLRIYNRITGAWVSQPLTLGDEFVASGIGYYSGHYFVYGSDQERSGHHYIYKIRGSDWAKVGEVRVSTDPFRHWDNRAAMAVDTNNGEIFIVYVRRGTSFLNVERYNANLGFIYHNVDFNNLGISANLGDAYVGSTDDGVWTLYVSIDETRAIAAFPVGTLAYSPSRSFAAAGNALIRGFMYVGGTTNRFVSYSRTGHLHTYSGHKVDQPVTVSYTWYDDNGTVRETREGPVRSYTIPRRSWLAIETGVPPDSGVTDPLQVDKANKVGIYVGIGAGGRKRQAYLGVDGNGVSDRVIWIDTITTNLNSPPTANTFLGGQSSTGKIVSGAESGGSPLLEISGDGSIKSSKITLRGYELPRVQRGQVNGNFNNSPAVDLTVTFPQAFSGNPTVIATPVEAGNIYYGVSVKATSPTGATLRLHTFSGGSVPWGCYVNWIAVGT